MLFTETPRESERVTWTLLLSITSALLGSLQFGYNTGVINSPESIIKDFINETSMSRDVVLTNGELTTIWAVIVSIFAVGGMLGAVLTNFWAEKFGRRQGMMVNCVFGVVAGLLMLISYYAQSFSMIIIGRLIVGFQCGLYTGLVPVYLSEISYSSVRGALGTAHQFGVTLGVTISQILGFPEIAGNTQYWSILLGITIIPATLQFVMLVFCPESPRFLIMSCHNQYAAESALKQLRGTDNVEDEVQEILEENIEQSTQRKMNIVSVLTSRALRWPLLIAVVMQLSQQLSGINGVLYYSAGLFQQTGMTKRVAQYATSGIGGVLVVMTAVSVPLMDRAGRRPLHLTGLVGMLVSSIGITVALALQNEADWLRIVSIVFVLLYVLFFAVGPGSIPWLIVSELFTYAPRSAAMSIAVFVNWLSNFAVGFLFPSMMTGLQQYVFLPFSVLLIFFVVFIYKFLPETRNRSYLAISEAFKIRDTTSFGSTSDVSPMLSS